MGSGSRQRSNSSGSDSLKGFSPTPRKAPSRRLNAQGGGQTRAKGTSKTRATSAPQKRAANAPQKRVAPAPQARAASAAPTRSASAPPPSSRTVRLESHTVADVRRASEAASRTAIKRERAGERRRKARIPFTIAGVVLGLAVLLLVAYLILVNTSVFEIKQIDVEGADHLTDQEVQALVSIPQGTNLLNVDAQAVEKSLERDSWVKSAEVVRVFPDTIKIVVTERAIGALVEVTTGQEQTIQNWALSDDGMWLMVVPTRDTEVGRNLSEKIYEDADAVLHITGVPYGLEPQIGAYCTDESVNNALAIISGMTTQLADQVKLVNAAESESIVLTLDSNIEIAFGDSNDIRDKERVCLKIMEEYPTAVYINVRVVDRPTWRSTS